MQLTINNEETTMAVKAPNKTATKTSKATRVVSETHKAAMAVGRNDARVIRSYLEALRENKPQRGRVASPEKMRARLAEIEETIGNADPLAELLMTQERVDLRAKLTRLAEADTEAKLAELEASFIESAPRYSTNKGISYTTWRAIGVPREVLAKAGLKP